MDSLMIFFFVVAVVGMIAIVIKLLKTPIKWFFKILLNTLGGFVALFFLNFMGGFVGLSLGLNWINALVVGFLGFPGVILLLLIKYLF